MMPCTLARTIAIALFLSVTAEGTAMAAPPSSPTKAQIDEKAMLPVLEKRTAGLAIAVMRDGRLVYSKGYGFANLETRTPMSDESVFRIASITKQFTATAVMTLVERGSLKLTDHLSKFIPEFPRADEITIYQLLTHTSGIANYTQKDILAKVERDDHEYEEFLKIISAQSPILNFKPGEHYQYSNSNYYILGVIIQRISKMSLQEFFKENLFKPAELHNTAIDDYRDVVPNRASGYALDPAASQGFRNAEFTSMTVPGPAGGLRSTVLDLVKWEAALLNGKIVKPETVALMIAPGRLNDGRLASEAVWGQAPGKAPDYYRYGIGMISSRVAGFDRIGHDGGINGFGSQLDVFDRGRLTIVVLANTRNVTDGVAADLVHLFLDKPVRTSGAEHTK